MQFKFGFLFIICLTSSINQIFADRCKRAEAETAEVCLGNKNVEIQISPNEFTCQVNTISRSKVRDDYTYTEGVGYHKLHTQAKTWNEARKVCRDEDGHLAVIDSKEEQQVLFDMFKNRKSDVIGDASQAWLGAHNFYNSGDWVTVVGEPLSYADWAPGEPNKQGDNEHCLSLLSADGEGMNDSICDIAFAFFCEIPDTCT